MTSKSSQESSPFGRQTPLTTGPTSDSSDTLANPSGYGHATQQPIQPAPAVVENRVTPKPVEFRRQKIDELNWKDVASLIINKMVGTGIFSRPFDVLIATNNRDIAVVLWILGFLFTVFSMLVYLELARDLPYSAGEMSYLDELFSSRKKWWIFSGPSFTMLAYTLYATYSILLCNTTLNSMEFAWQVFQATNPAQDAQPDQRVLRLIAVSITTLICGLLYFSSSTSRKFNRWAAYLKLALLVVVIIAGGVYQHRHFQADTPNGPQADTPNGPQAGRTVPANWASAILSMLFAFDGWENATLVTGEIPHYRVLKRGFVAGVLSVGFAYVTIISMYFTFPVPLDKGGSNNFNYMAAYFGDSDQDSDRVQKSASALAAHQAASVLTALSAVGSMISVTYTCVAVNRVVAWSNIIPGSPIWRKSSPVSTAWWKAQIETFRGREPTTSPDPFLFAVPRGTPEGAVILHWLVTVFWICASAAYKDFNSAAAFPGYLLVYGHCFATTFVGFGFLWFKHDTTKRPPPKGWNAGTPWRFDAMPRLPYWVLGTVTCSFSVAVITSALLLENARVYFCVTGGIIVVTVAYWYAFVKPANATKILGRIGLEITQGEHGKDDRYNYERTCEVCRDDVSESGIAHRHAEDGFRTFNQIWAKEGSNSGERLLEIFGGPEALIEKPVSSTGLDFEMNDDPVRRSGGVQRSLREWERY